MRKLTLAPLALVLLVVGCAGQTMRIDDLNPDVALAEGEIVQGQTKAQVAARLGVEEVRMSRMWSFAGDELEYWTLPKGHKYRDIMFKNGVVVTVRKR